jgi:LCP family protein required for cell wall assembly
MHLLAGPAESKTTTFAPALKGIEAPGGSEPGAAAGAQRLLEAQAAKLPGGDLQDEELSNRASSHGTACSAPGAGQGCMGKQSFLELIPPASTTMSPGKTLLILGVDSRHGGLISRTDTIMLMSLNQESEQISLLSIPRDLYVFIPGHGRDRINTALVHGAATGNLPAGIRLLKETIEQTLGVTIDHYILVDFKAAVRSIDALGGIDVYVPYEINDPTFPDMDSGFDPLYIPQGQHHFTGEMALKYARTRHQDNDYFRAQRQQQLLLAIRQQVLNLGITELLASAPALYKQVRHGVFTDLSVVEMVQLAQMASDVPLDNIETEVLDDDHLTSTFTEAGEFVLVLKPEAVTSLIEKLFGNSEG